ncbi:hypothetical protein H0H81_003659 [Sphagnurus paluster]|uniref:P-type ATPase C-terminal domain-containing protein n=1 Tax=Sphagnurus paluster TaxID=117069 RepID=A0A9P7GLD2_9AGAR|nr:hypothetical protein H0H81_003659 [Sphagnurus paluster]
MAVPELYHYGRRGTWFGLKAFFVYLFDGLYQSVIIYFLIVYTYGLSPTSRKDGYDINLHEFSTVSDVALYAYQCTDIVNLDDGDRGRHGSQYVYRIQCYCLERVDVLCCLHRHHHRLAIHGPSHVFFTTLLPVTEIPRKIIYSYISPGYAVTSLYGNYYILFTSAYFWLCIPITFFVSLAPRYLARAWNFGFAPDDLDTMRWISKYDPHRDLSDATLYTSNLKAMRRRPTSMSSRRTSRSRFGDSVASLALRPSMDTTRRASMVDVRAASRTDMATGLVSIDRGFDFVTEENGVAMRRMQTNLSEKRAASRNDVRLDEEPPSPSSSRKGKEALSHMFSLRRGLRKKLSGSRKGE